MALSDPRGALFDLPRSGRRIIKKTQDVAATATRKPSVSVVVPCYNYGRFLGDCVDSLVSQDGVTVDVTIIDDKSPDGSGEVADALAAKHPEVTSIRHEINRGHIATYNEGLAAATGDYVVLLDADDIITPGAFGRATALMESNPSVGMTYGHPLSFTDTIPPLVDRPVRSWSVWEGHEWVRAQVRRGLSIVFSPEVVMRRSVQEKVGGFRPELPHSADLDCWLRIAAVSDIGRVNGPDQALRRVHSASMMQSGYGTVLADLRGRLDGYESFFKLDAGPLADREALHELMLRNTAVEAIDFAAGLLQRTDQPDGDAAGTVDWSSTTAEYIAFARQIYPAAESLRQYRDYVWLSEHSISSYTRADRLRAQSLQLRRTVAGKYAWQRWYWQGA